MKKLLILTALGVGLVAFVGLDVVKGAIHRARTDIRDALTADVPLKTQLAEARAQVDAYAESIIRGEVAADNLSEMIQGVEREVRVLESRVGSERVALVDMKRKLEVVPTSTGPRKEDQEALRRARVFKAQSELLERRRADLARLQEEYQGTQASLQKARGEQTRLTEEVKVLAAEIESLDARTAAAQTRRAVGDATISSSGFAEARQRLTQIENRVKERNKLLHYYEYERAPVDTETADTLSTSGQTDPRAAIDEALAAFPEAAPEQDAQR
jgi:DNA repair exonuclease SbcCD ATPase subunit